MTPSVTAARLLVIKIGSALVVDPDEAAPRNLAHQSRVFILPRLPDGGIFQDPVGDDEFGVVVTVQGTLDPVGRLAHETRMSDGTPLHPQNLLFLKPPGIRDGARNS